MRSELDHDQLLIDRMLAPPSLDDARSSLDYWQLRRRSLPLYRRAARREAKEMAGRWQERVHAAEQAQFEASTIGRLLAALGISGPWLRRVRFARKVGVWLAWVFVTRKLRLVVQGFAAFGLIVVLAFVVVLFLVVNQLA
jgi:hypothetical protein